MSRTDTTQDSSMEEILASIRRIISEDAGPAAFAAEPARKPTAAAAPPPPMRPVDFGQLPIPAFTATVRPATVVAPSAPPFAVAAPLAPVPPAAADDDDDILDLDASYAAVTRRPPAESAAPAPTLALVREAIVAGPAIPAPEAAPALTDAAPLDELLQPDPDPMPEPAVVVPQAEAAPVLPATVPASEPMQAAPLDISEPVRAEPVFASPPPEAEMAAPVVALAEPIVTAETALPPSDSSASAIFAAGPLAAAPPVDLTPAAAMAEAVAHRTPEIAAAPAPAEIAPVVAAAAPAVIAPPPIAAAMGGARTMEDMVAEMLRPMLRDWLDSNMPRIIEKTLAKPGE